MPVGFFLTRSPSAGVGLQAMGLFFRLFWLAQPRPRKTQKNYPEAAYRYCASIACHPGTWALISALNTRPWVA